MAGVAVGGAVTYATQRTTQRAAERTDERRQAAQLTEERRAEQIRTLMEFIRCALEAEGVAHARLPRWEVGDEWYKTARPAMDGLRIAANGIELLCAPALHAPMKAYARALNEAVWEERGEEELLSDLLDPLKADFLGTARDSLGG
jgi:hypothetical protein